MIIGIFSPQRAKSKIDERLDAEFPSDFTWHQRQDGVCTRYTQTRLLVIHLEQRRVIHKSRQHDTITTESKSFNTTPTHTSACTTPSDVRGLFSIFLSILTPSLLAIFLLHFSRHSDLLVATTLCILQHVRLSP